MSFIINYPFDTPTDYTYDENKIVIDGGEAKLNLIDNPDQEYEEDFANDTGFTYDNTKAEFTDGKVQQIYYPPTDETFYANFATDIDGSRGLGTLTATSVGGSDVSLGKLDLAHNDVRYVTYDADQNADSQQTGCIRFWVTPNYSGTPSGIQPYFFVGKPTLGANRIYISHDASGNLAIYSNSESGGSNFALVTAWSPTAGTEYNIELNYDLTAGATRVFIDGVQLGSTNTNTGTRDSDISIIKIGASHTGSLPTNFSTRRLEIFSTVQHTANFTPEYPTETAYLSSKVILPAYPTPNPGDMQSVEDFTVIEQGTPRYTVGIDEDNQYYWNSSYELWIPSDQTYTQASPSSDIIAHIVDLFSDETSTSQVQAMLYFEDCGSQSNCSDIIMEYTDQVYPSDNPYLEVNTTIYLDNIVSTIETSTKTGSDELKYTVKVDNTWYWVDGGVIAETTGSNYAESNTNAEWAVVLPDWDPPGGVLLKWRGFLHSEDGLTTPALQNIEMTYNSRGTAEDDVNLCNVYGYSKKPDGSICTDPIIIYLPKESVLYKNNIVIENVRVEVIPLTLDGYWSVNLVDSENMIPNMQYIFEINGKKYYRTVPDATERAFNAL